MALPRYTPDNWYWSVGGDQANVWSSARAMSVPVGDADYTAWLVNALRPTPIGSMAELQSILAEQFPPGTLETYCVYKRWLKEQGGLTLSSGMPIATDDRAQAKINGVVIAATADAAFTTQWHAADGTYWPLDATAIKAMSGELQTHINACFDTSAETMAGIAGGTITTRDDIDAAFAAVVTQSRKVRQKR